MTEDLGAERVHMVRMLDGEGVRVGGGESADLTVTAAGPEAC